MEIVIPTTEEEDSNITTLDSIPDDITVHIERRGSLNEARNRGVSKVEDGHCIIMDDDIVFDSGFLQTLEVKTREGVLVGLGDYDFDLIIGRVMSFRTDDWRDVGGFDERLGSHMGDTDFALKFAKAGKTVETLDRDSVEHIEHSRSITTFDRAWRTAYLMAKHPTEARRIAEGMLG